MSCIVLFGLFFVGHGWAFECNSEVPQTLTGGIFPSDNVSTQYGYSSNCLLLIPRKLGYYVDLSMNLFPSSGAMVLFYDNYQSVYYDGKYTTGNPWYGFVSAGSITIRFNVELGFTPGDFSFSWVYKRIPYYQNSTTVVTLISGQPGTLIPVYNQSSSFIFNSYGNSSLQAANKPDVPIFYMMYTFLFEGEGTSGKHLGSLYSAFRNYSYWRQIVIGNGGHYNFTLVTAPPEQMTDYGVILVKPYADVAKLDYSALIYWQDAREYGLSSTRDDKLQAITVYSGIHTSRKFMLSRASNNNSSSIVWQVGDYLPYAEATYSFRKSSSSFPQQIPGRLNTIIRSKNEIAYINTNQNDTFYNVPLPSTGIYSSGNYPFPNLPQNNTLTLNTARPASITVTVLGGANGSDTLSVICPTGLHLLLRYNQTATCETGPYTNQFQFYFDSSDRNSTGVLASYSITEVMMSISTSHSSGLLLAALIIIFM